MSFRRKILCLTLTAALTFVVAVCLFSIRCLICNTKDSILSAMTNAETDITIAGYARQSNAWIESTVNNAKERADIQWALRQLCFVHTQSEMPLYEELSKTVMPMPVMQVPPMIAPDMIVTVSGKVPMGIRHCEIRIYKSAHSAIMDVGNWLLLRTYSCTNWNEKSATSLWEIAGL